MVRHKQPRTLYSTCHKWLAEYLGDEIVNAGSDIASKQTLSTVRVKLRPYFIEHIPIFVRTSLLEETSEFLFQKSLNSGVDCDYGRSILYLLYLLLSKEIKRLKVTLCCYYGCRDMEGVLRCIKKNGSALEHLELSRSSLLRMDPLLFRNVLSSATKLNSLVVKNICSDAMLKLIGTHCHGLQYLDISNSKQVSDVGIESLCCQVQIRDKRDIGDLDLTQTTLRMLDKQSMHGVVTVREDFGDSQNTTVGCSGGMPWWKDLRAKMRNCLSTDAQNNSNEILVEVKQVLHPLCSTLKVFDITDTSVTNSGLLTIFRKMSNLHSLGEYSISENFLRSLCVVSSLKMDKFGLMNVHTRKITNAGMYNLVHVFTQARSLTCWEPQFDIKDLSYFSHIKHITMLRIAFSETVLNQIIRYIETCKDARNLEKIFLEFILQDEFLTYNPPIGMLNFDISRIFANCDKLKVFIVEFKDSLLVTPPVGFANYNSCSATVPQPSMSSLVHVQLGQVVQNSAVAAILQNCPNLKHLHSNNCPDLSDLDLASCIIKSVSLRLECFYIYEAPHLTYNAFQMLLEGFPNLLRFGNLTRWAVNCEGIQQVVRTIRENNLEMEILCGSHWFSSKCLEKIRI